MRTRDTISALCVLWLATACGLAQNYSIDWSTVDGGGGTSTGGVYSVSGTIGQPDAAAMSGGTYTLHGGFWGLIAAIQPPGAPLLTITHTATNTVILSWPSSATGFTLQTNISLTAGTWGNSATTPSDDGSNKFIIVNPPVGNRFFRLIK